MLITSDTATARSDPPSSSSLVAPTCSPPKRSPASSPGSPSASSAKRSGSGSAILALTARGIPLALTAGQATLLIGGGLASVALWGVIGVAVGAIVRSQVGTIVGLLAWGLIIDSLLFAFVPSVGRYSPNRAENALEGLTTRHLLPAAAGAAVLLAWAVALTIAGVAATARRDVD